MTDLTGHGTLYDGDENELGAVAYRITHEGTDGGPIIAWAGELTFVEEDAVLEPGTYLLETEDGTRGEVEIDPSGTTSGGAREVTFTGIGVLDPATG
ncbi:MAG: hypothetical protein M3R02_17580 [Chloroflexota bacterium]|nr:hypothetical protein [Chloroflexota bacterium]